MQWLHQHHLWIGILADSLTFLGGLILARDAFRRLRDLKATRTDSAFQDRFPQLALTDDELHDALLATRWAITGFLLITFGFACQLLLRILE
jgi:hypothetical protein